MLDKGKTALNDDIKSKEFDFSFVLYNIMFSESQMS